MRIATWRSAGYLALDVHRSDAAAAHERLPQRVRQPRLFGRVQHQPVLHLQRPRRVAPEPLFHEVGAKTRRDVGDDGNTAVRAGGHA